MPSDLPARALEAAFRPRVFAMHLPTYGAARVTVAKPREEMVRLIVNYERAVAHLPQTELPVRHFYMEGRLARHVYAREISIGAGVAAVGRVHKYECINIISKGRVLVASPEGVHEIAAPFTWVSAPGSKRALYVLEDLIWTTIHLTDELDAARIKDDLGVVSYEEYRSFCENLALEGAGAPQDP